MEEEMNIRQEITQDTREARRSRRPAKKSMKKGLKVLLIILGVMVVLMIAFIVFIIGGKDASLNAKIGDVNLAVVDDGTYTGSYGFLRFSNTVEVTVKDHAITGIKVVSPQVFAKPETMNTMVEEVLDAQALQVDAVSGATATSKAFLKAVENALLSAIG